MNTNALPTWPNNINQHRKYTMPDGTQSGFTIIDEIAVQSTQPPTEMIFYWQKLQFDTGEIEIRLAYYIIGKKPRFQGQWVWGQFAPSICPQDLKTLVNEATKRGWI